MTSAGIAISAEKARQFDETYRVFKETGYVVFEREVPAPVIAEMRRVFDDYYVEYSKQKPNLKRVLMHLPFKAPLYHSLFVENAAVLGIAKRALGNNFVCSYFGSETALPEADYMKAHFDLAFLNRLRFLNPLLSLINKTAGTLGYYYGIHVSVPLVDAGLENAPFEIWPRTNRLSLRASKPEKVLMPAGSLMVRDIRNLHRGTPHMGNLPRPFLSLVYLRPWVPGWRPPEIPSDVYEALSPQMQRMFRHARIGEAVPDPQAWAVRRRSL
jgi:hypothetical protein